MASTLPHLRALSDHFWSKVDKGGGCWEWTAGASGNGYGHFAITPARSGLERTITFRAHRAAWMLHHDRDVPDGLVVDHRCNNKRCCNPTHLATIPGAANSTAGMGLVTPELLPSGRYKVRFRVDRGGRRVATSRTFDTLAAAEAFAVELRKAYAIPPRIAS